MYDYVVINIYLIGIDFNSTSEPVPRKGFVLKLFSAEIIVWPWISGEFIGDIGLTTTCSCFNINAHKHYSMSCINKINKCYMFCGFPRLLFIIINFRNASVKILFSSNLHEKPLCHIVQGFTPVVWKGTEQLTHR